VVGIGSCLAVSQSLQLNICDKARLAWRRELRKQYLDWRLTRDTRGRNRVALAFAISLCVLAVVLAISTYRNERNLIALEVGVITLFLGLLLAWRKAGLQRLKTIAAAASIRTGQPLPLKGPLRFARWLRGNPSLKKLSKWVVWILIPAISALIVVAAGLVIANRVAFDVASSAGAYCRGTPNADGHGHDKIDGVAHFSTDNLCASTGLFLQAGRRYRITIDASSGDWFDKGVRTDIGGFSAHLWASPLKRWWRENWFQPIARIGARGNDEYVLSPKAPLDPVDYQRCTTSYPKGEERASTKISDKAAAELIACASVPSTRLKLVADITAKTNGELFVYVNDAVLAWPADYFYRNNRGTASVSVVRTDE
jgi:hypothetical protein